MLGLLPYSARVMLAALLVAAVVASYFSWAKHQQAIGEDRATARYSQMIAEQKTKAATILAKETARATAMERELQTIKDQQEETDAHNQKTIQNLTGRLNTLAGISGRLRDPHGDTGCGPGSGATPGASAAHAGGGADNQAHAGRLLSENLSGLLRDLTREADEINNAYLSCRADSEAIRAGFGK